MALWRRGKRRIDALLEQEMQADALQSYDSHRSETIADLRSSVLLALVLLGLGSVVAVATSVGVGRRIVAGERALHSNAERLRVTLSSIGDGVITADLRGRVVSLNPVAEGLTDWNQAEAAGRPIEEVFRIVGESNREPVENPAQRALREGCVTGLTNDTAC